MFGHTFLFKEYLCGDKEEVKENNIRKLGMVLSF
jgi:hypothetical protein